MDADEVKKTFHFGEQSIKLLVTATELKCHDVGAGSWALRVARGDKLKAELCKGASLHHETHDTDGAIETTQPMYFYEDGKHKERKLKLELVIDGKSEAFARFDCGLFNSTGTQELTLKNDKIEKKGTCTIHVKVLK